MAAPNPEPAIRVIIAADKSTVELVIPPGLNRMMMTPEVCASLLAQAGVEVTESVREAVAALLTGEMPEDEPVRAVVAHSRPPAHGVDGHVEWLVALPSASDEAPTQTSYYDRSAFVMVNAGQTIGRLHPPTEGEDGRDVTGTTLPARRGREARVQLDETILCDARGNLIAQDEGVLIRTGASACIRRVLEVPDYVDFSTGNIDFHGDVMVNKGVRDLFIVRATGNVEVAGLIEAATIIAGQDLVAKGGFAGRERGTANCGGSLRAKYLDSVEAEVAHELRVDREIINCKLIVHGDLLATHGAIIGGRTVVTGRIEVGTLGSGGNVPTQVVLGSVPRLEPLHDQLTGFIDKVSHRSDQLRAEQEQFARLAGGPRATATDRERQTELMYEASNADLLLGKAQPTLENLEQRIDEHRTIDVTIHRKLYPGVIFVVGRDRFRINTDVSGPLHIGRDGQGMMIFERSGGGGVPLAQIADVDMMAA